MNNQSSMLAQIAEIPIRWSDVDAFGHVNNACYFTYFEQVRFEWCQEKLKEVNFQDYGPVVVTAHCTFRKPIFYPETILVKLFVGPPGNSSYDCYYEIHSKTTPNLIYADGTTKVVWVDRKQGRSMPLPEAVRKHLPHPHQHGDR